MRRCKKRPLTLERLENRQLLTGWHNADDPLDVNMDQLRTPVDALIVINRLNRDSSAGPFLAAAPEGNRIRVDVNNDGMVTAIDALQVVNELNRQASVSAAPTTPEAPTTPGAPTTPEARGFEATFRDVEAVDDADPVEILTRNLLTEADVQTLLTRASMATPSDDAIIAVVDRNGTILGVRVEEGVDARLSDPERRAFAIDGAVAKARTAAFFSSNAAPLTSRTVRFISQSTMTQREVESSPLHRDESYRGPGFVAPIGVGGHFPPEIPFTPQVDLFAIEHQSRDSQRHAGADGLKGTSDDFTLQYRFNADPDQIPKNAEPFLQRWPESYGVQAGTAPNSQSRGIATLPGGIPLYKFVTDRNGELLKGVPLSESVNLVGGIGVFFPGPDGFATYEQGFVHASKRGGEPQTERERTNASKVLEAEYMAFVAAAGAGIFGPDAFVRDLSPENRELPPLPLFPALNARIDLVGITLEIYGPTPSREFRGPGIDQLLQTGRQLGGPTAPSGSDLPIAPGGLLYQKGQPVPEQWLVAPHDSAQIGGLTAAEVEQIIRQGIAEAERTRAAIRLDVDNGFRPGVDTAMVFAVADTNGELLGVYRMPDATIFSIDVAIAKARNTAYYADPLDLVPADRIDFNGDGLAGAISTSFDRPGDTVPLGTALTNRTFRFLVEPRYPTGIELPSGPPPNDPTEPLCDQDRNLCKAVGPQSILRLPGINPRTAENLVNHRPLPASVYADLDSPSTLAFDAFVPSRNFRDPGDAEVLIHGTGKSARLANQNGVVFFPGSTPLYVNRGKGPRLVGGLGVSGDGVDQDDVVTAAGQQGFAAPYSIRVDQYIVGDVRLPFQKFNRNPRVQ